MKILIKIQKSPTQHFLVDLPDDILIDEIKNLINKGRYSKATVTALSKGKFIREITDDDAKFIDADLILSEHHAHFDLI